MAQLPPVALVIFSNDLDDYLENIELERKFIEEALENYDDTNRLKVVTRSSVDIKELFRLFNRYKGRIALFHFAGHASGNGLQLSNTNLTAQYAQAGGIAQLLKREVEDGQLETVFLNGCSTAPQVETLSAAGVKSIIATNCPINDNTAIHFAQQFYRSLAQTDQPIGTSSTNIKQAFETATAFLKTSEKNITVKETQRGLKLKRNKKDNDIPWELYTSEPDWQLPNEIINIYLPDHIFDDDLLDDDMFWRESLKRTLEKQGLVVKNSKNAAFEHYGWLIETFLQKMCSPPGRKRNLKRLSLMAEAFYASLRYLCFIQTMQLLQLENTPTHPMLKQFLNMNSDEYIHFDYLDFLSLTTDLLKGNGLFVPEIADLVAKLADQDEEVSISAIYLEDYRKQLLKNTINEEHLEDILDEYLTALVYWLRNISFIGKYRLVSIKDIELKYSLGEPQKQFIHVFGELHGMFNDKDENNRFAQLEERKDYGRIQINDDFSYNQSVLLLNGTEIKSALHNIKNDNAYLPLSPLIIDRSVFSVKESQTPEIYYFVGQQNNQYHFAAYKNELPFGEKRKIPSNKILIVKSENSREPKLNDLSIRMKNLLKPYIIRKSRRRRSR